MNPQDHPNYQSAMDEILCDLMLPHEPRVIQRIMEALRFANLDHYNRTIPTNPLHEIFMAKAKGYTCKKLASDKNLMDEYRYWEQWMDLELLKWKRLLLPTNEK